VKILEAIESRTSALKLGEPAPSHAQIEQIIHAGTRAPDHGRLRPWRFVVLEGAARAQLGDAMAAMLQAKVPDITAEQLDKERAKSRRAPTIIAVAARITPGKIPEIEQVLAAAAATQNMFLAAQALGYGVMWKTGGAAYSASVKTLLGLQPGDHIVALLYVGTTVTPGPLVPAPMDGVVRWME
jgi:nitroreductase